MAIEQQLPDFRRPEPSRALPPIGRDLHLALGLGLGLAAVVGVAEFIPVVGWLRALLQVVRLPLGLAYVLYIPGYCLTAALLPSADDVDGIDRAGLSLGMSVAWVSILALVLDWLPWGLRLWPILLGELVSIGLFVALGWWRRSRLAAGEAHAPQLDWRPRVWWHAISRLERRIYLLCAGSLVVAGLAAAWVFLVPSPDEYMTEFYVLGREGQAESYPRDVAVGQPLTVTMGIRNLERAAHTYRVEVYAIDVWEDRQQQVAAAGPFSLGRDEALEQVLPWSMPWAAQDQQVEFHLFSDAQEADDSGPYCLLRLWMNVQEPEA